MHFFLITPACFLALGYGFWSNLLGLLHALVDSGILMFCNHGCNGTFNYGSGRHINFTETTVDPKQPPDSIFQRQHIFSPVIERNIRSWLSSGEITYRHIEKGEEILCNYLEYIGDSSDWEEEVLDLREQCMGSKLGTITELMQTTEKVQPQRRKQR
jgi:hypothetical protein